MDWLNWIISNWYVLVVIGIALVVIYIAITDKARVLEWLRWCVVIAENELGKSTGQLKLHKVYTMFIEKFPVFSKFVPFNVFSKWVDIALEWMKEQINKNNAIKIFIENNN